MKPLLIVAVLLPAAPAFAAEKTDYGLGEPAGFEALAAGRVQEGAALFCAAAERADKAGKLDAAIENFEYCGTAYMQADDMLPAVLKMQAARTRAEARKKQRPAELGRLFRKEGSIFQVARKDQAVAADLFRMSLKHYAKAKGTQQERASVHHSLGVSLSHLGLREEAAAEFRRGAALITRGAPSGTRVMLRADLGTLLSESGRTAEAEKVFAAMLADMKATPTKAPAMRRAFGAYARHLRRTGKAVEAAEYEAGLAKLPPGDEEDLMTSELDH